MTSIHQHIATQINGYAGGSILFPGDFRGFGSEDAIKMSLSRHAESGLLERLGHGIYLTKRSKGKLQQPSLEEIAYAIAKKERIKIKPTGAFALHKLGLTTELPADIIYITDGEPRNIRIGNKRLVFKAATPKKLSLSAGISGLLVQGLDELGKEGITDALKDQITKKLLQETEAQLMADLRLAPGWLYNLLFKLNRQLTR